MFVSGKMEVSQAWNEDESARVQRFDLTCKAWANNIKEAEESLSSAESVTEVAGSTDAEIDEDEKHDAALEAAAPAERDKQDEALLEQQEDDYKLWEPWTHQDLPELAKPAADEAQFWMHLATHVFNWSEQHACAPCTYEQLLGPGDPTVLMGSLIKLVGKTFWERIYAHKRVVMATDIVPRHMGFVLYCALQKPYTAAQETLGKDAAEKAKESAKTSNKIALKEMKEKQEKLEKKNWKGCKAPLGRKTAH